MKLTKETLKRIIKEEMMQVMHEMDSEQTNGLSDTLKELQSALEEREPMYATFKFKNINGDLEVEYKSAPWRGNKFHETSIVEEDAVIGIVVIDGKYQMDIDEAVLFFTRDLEV